eukprot:7136729-Alexandrium_andersonii.AAC.1
MPPPNNRHTGIFKSMGAPNVQFAIRPRPVGAAIRLDPQSAMRQRQSRFMRSNLRGPNSGVNIGPRSYRG